MSAGSRARFYTAVRAEPVELGLACLLLAAEVDPHLDIDIHVADLDALADGVRPAVPAGGDPRVVAATLEQELGRRDGFGGSAEDYGDLRSSLLPDVLSRRRGLPILLSVVWLEVARRLGVAAYGVGLPGHFVVGIGDPDGAHQLVDPFAGGRLLSTEDAADRVWRTTGTGLTAEHLRPAPPGDILLRILANIRNVSTLTVNHIQAARTRLWAVELSMLLPRHPAALRRELGELRVRLGDYAGGADELEAYAAVVRPLDPVAAESALNNARMARARLN